MAKTSKTLKEKASTNNGQAANNNRTLAKRKKPGPQQEFQKDPKLRKATDKIKNDIVDEIEQLPIDPKTKKPFYGAAKRVIDHRKKIYPWLTTDMIKSLQKRRKVKEKKATTKTTTYIHPLIANLKNLLPSIRYNATGPWTTC